MMFHALIPVFSQQVDSHAVSLRVDNFEQPIAHGDELARIDQTLEDGILHTLPVVETSFGCLPQSSPSGRRNGGDIIGDQDLHTTELAKRGAHFQIKAG